MGRGDAMMAVIRTPTDTRLPVFRLRRLAGKHWPVFQLLGDAQVAQSQLSE
jgi:hypothetical protein